MRWTHLVTLMDAEAARQEHANDHPASILLREGADHIRALHSCDAVITPAPDPRNTASEEAPDFVVNVAHPMDARTAEAVGAAVRSALHASDTLRRTRGQ